MLGMVVFVVLAGVFFVFAENEAAVEFTGEIKEFDIVAKQFSFEPGIIEVSEGDLVRINIKSIDVVHSISIPDFGVNEKLFPGKDVEFEFVADKVGEFGFFVWFTVGKGIMK